MFQSLSVLSIDPLAKYAPVLLKATEVIGSKCFDRV